MRAAALAVLLAASAAAQNPMYGYDKPAESTAPAAAPEASSATVAVSTPTAPADGGAAGHGFKVGGGTPKVALSRPMHAVIHKEAADWEPLSLRQGGDPGQAENAVALKVVKIKGRMKGENTKAKAFARVHKGKKDSRWLVVSVYPKSLERRRTHFELRFRIFEGFVEEAAAAAVTVTARDYVPPARPRNSYDLRAEGIEYQEELPGSGSITVSALDPRPGASAANSGRLEKAEFADKDLGFVNLSWSARGVAGSKK